VLGRQDYKLNNSDYDELFPYNKNRTLNAHATFHCLVMILTDNGKKLKLYKPKLKLNAVALVREQIIPTERPPLVGEVVPTFADGRCCVVSATDSHGR
jgi:hypothetical protein